MEPIKSKEVVYIDRKYRVDIFQDEDCCLEWDDLGDHLGTIYSNHRNWNPDKHSIEEILDEDNRPDSENYIYVPIWMLDHSGVTISAGARNPYNDPWDSSCAGLIAVSRRKAAKEYGELNEETVNKIKDVMIAEIRELDMLYRGEVYGYVVMDCNGDEEVALCSCWGHITDNIDEVIEEGEVEAIAEAKDWYRKNGIQLHIPFDE